MNKAKIYCFPYAGGTMNIYNDWIKIYKDIAEVVPMEYNGHGTRFCEPFYAHAFEAAEDMCSRICSDAPKEYIIYGHSMGSLIALLTAVKLLEKNINQPSAIIVGGMRPPHLKYKDERIADMSREQFIKKIKDLGQTDAELLESPEFIDIIYEIMTNDSRICEDFETDWNKLKISVPILAITGSEDDEAPLEDMMEWQLYTTADFSIKEFKSNHFFAFECSEFHPYMKEMITGFLK